MGASSRVLAEQRAERPSLWLIRVPLPTHNAAVARSVVRHGDLDVFSILAAIRSRHLAILLRNSRELWPLHTWIARLELGFREYNIVLHGVALFFSGIMFTGGLWFLGEANKSNG